MTKTNKEQLIERFLSFDKNAYFDGYPAMSGYDDGLIFSAADDANRDMIDPTHLVDACVHLAYLMSEHVKTREQYDNAKRYFDCFVDTIWDCNMSEGSNEVYAAINEIDQK